jgi:RimJ/RimL family protein N-acetyltransferase
MKIFAETDRLLLREILPTDIDGMYELDANPEVHKYLGNNTVKNKSQVIDIIDFIRQQYQDHGIGRWAIVDKKTNEFMGWTGLKFVTETTNDHKNFYEVGYRLIQRFWGQGFATESAIASLDYAFNQLKIKEVYAAASCDNIGSNKILEKIGMENIGTFYYEDIKCNWYKIENSKKAT